MMQQQTNTFLRILSKEDFALVRLHLMPFPLRTGQCPHHAGDPISRVVFPHSGIVALRLAPCGRPVKSVREHAAPVTALLGRQAIIGGSEAVAAAPAASTAEVLVDGHASAMAASAFREVWNGSKTFRRLAAEFDSALFAHLQRISVCHAMHPVEGRLCRLIAEIVDHTNSETIPVLQSTLAQLLGVRRTTVTLVIGRLEAAGVLRSFRGRLQIISRDELMHHSCGCRLESRRYLETLLAPPMAPTLPSEVRNLEANRRPALRPKSKDVA